MAITTEILKLTCGDDELDLLSGDDGFKLAEGGWVQAVAFATDGIYEPVTEVLTLRVTGADHNAIIASLRTLNTFLRRANEYVARPTDRDPVWLETRPRGATYSQRAVVRGGAIPEPGAGFFAHPFARGGQLTELHLGLERGPFWESANLRGSTQSVKAWNWMASYNTTADAIGDMPARVTKTKFFGSSGGGGPFYEFWMGFRSRAYGYRANFEMVWEAEDGQVGDDTVSGTSDNTASNYQKCVFTPADTVLAERVNLRMSDVTTNYSDQLGSFLVLLRAKSTGTRDFIVQMRSGVGGAFSTHSRVLVDATSWMLYPLGYINISAVQEDVMGSTVARDFCISLRAQGKATGAGNLDIDAVTLVPISEGFLHVEGCEVQYSAGDYPVFVGVNALDQISAVAYVSATAPRTGYDRQLVSPDQHNYFQPAETDLGVVFVGQREGSHVLTDYARLELRYHNRFLTLRGLIY